MTVNVLGPKRHEAPACKELTVQEKSQTSEAKTVQRDVRPRASGSSPIPGLTVAAMSWKRRRQKFIRWSAGTAPARSPGPETGRAGQNLREPAGRVVRAPSPP